MSFTNVPDAEELRKVSLRLYFQAWVGITEILNDWRSYRTQEVPDWLDKTSEYANISDNPYFLDWSEHIQKIQGDLQAIYTLIQQSQEIGLKAKIAQVSPFLLLQRLDPNIGKSGKWDFTDFQTVDARALPQIHAICFEPLPATFLRIYDEIRRNRNKIAHLGIYRDNILPHKLITILQRQYDALYSDQHWFAARIAHVSAHRSYRFRKSPDLAAVFVELRDTLPSLSTTQFKWLMGRPRTVQRYACPRCIEDADLAGVGIPAKEVPTTYLNRTQSAVQCVVCEEMTSTIHRDCSDRACQGTMLGARSGRTPLCLTCGGEQTDLIEEFLFEEEMDRDLSCGE